MMSTSSEIFSNIFQAIVSAYIIITYCSYREHADSHTIRIHALVHFAASACIYVCSDTIICTCLLKNVLTFSLLVMDDPLATVIQNISYVCLTECVNGFLVCNVGTFIF